MEYHRRRLRQSDWGEEIIVVMYQSVVSQPVVLAGNVFVSFLCWFQFSMYYMIIKIRYTKPLKRFQKKNDGIVYFFLYVGKSEYLCNRFYEGVIGDRGREGCQQITGL